MAPTMSARSKILTLDRLVELREDARRQGLTVAHCHGCFDIVHPGHIRHLEFAARTADILLVSVTGDAQIRKGVGRPLIPESLRAENLAALDSVDWVHVDPNATAVEMLTRVQPDIYIKGREYESNRDPRFLAEKEAVEAAGGRVVFSSGDVVFSSTAIIETMANEQDAFGRQLSHLTESHDLAPSSLDRITGDFAGRRVVVIGETIIDRYVMCRRPEIASESPVMTLHPTGERAFDGGAAIVAQHLAAMNAYPTLVTALPADDRQALALSERLRAGGVDVRSIECDEPLTVKERYLVGRQKVMKVDHGGPIALDERRRERLIELACDAATGDGNDTVDAVIFCDYGLGLLTPATLDRLIRRLRPRVPVMTGDISGRRSNLLRMKSLDLLCPSEPELRDAVGEFAEGLSAVVWKWFDLTKLRQAIVTMGEDGVVAFSRLPGVADDDDSWRQRLASEHIPSLAGAVVDELGCGDALLAAATLAHCAGANLVQAAYLGSLAAGIEARELGNVPVTVNAMRQAWGQWATRRLQFASAV